MTKKKAKKILSKEILKRMGDYMKIHMVQIKLAKYHIIITDIMQIILKVK